MILLFFSLSKKFFPTSSFKINESRSYFSVENREFTTQKIFDGPGTRTPQWQGDQFSCWYLKITFIYIAHRARVNWEVALADKLQDCAL